MHIKRLYITRKQSQFILKGNFFLSVFCSCVFEQNTFVLFNYVMKYHYLPRIHPTYFTFPHKHHCSYITRILLSQAQRHQCPGHTRPGGLSSLHFNTTWAPTKTTLRIFSGKLLCFLCKCIFLKVLQPHLHLLRRWQYLNCSLKVCICQ